MGNVAAGVTGFPIIIYDESMLMNICTLYTPYMWFSVMFFHFELTQALLQACI